MHKRHDFGGSWGCSIDRVSLVISIKRIRGLTLEGVGVVAGGSLLDSQALGSANTTDEVLKLNFYLKK